MLRLTPFAAVLSLVLWAAAKADEKSDADLKALVGTWKIELAELNEKNIQPRLKDVRLEIYEGGKYTMEFDQKKHDGTITLDASKTPKALDMKATTGPGKGSVRIAIYKLDADRLTVCYDYESEKPARPGKFESAAGKLLIVYKREKK